MEREFGIPDMIVKNLLCRKIRTLLTVFGIAIAVASES